MAEIMLAARLGPDSRWQVASAGLAAGIGLPATEQAVAVLAECGLDATTHRSQPVTQGQVDEAAVIVVMTAAHRQQLLECFPNAREKTFLLGSFSVDDGDIEDPIGASVDVYRRIRDRIGSALPGLIEFLECLEM
jgi:protein-tyrosine-phosphatase